MMPTIRIYDLDSVKIARGTTKKRIMKVWKKPIQVGDILYFNDADPMVASSEYRFLTAKCVSSERIKITKNGTVSINGKRLNKHQKEIFATDFSWKLYRKGDYCWKKMFKAFQYDHKLPFEGVVIGWERPAKCSGDKCALKDGCRRHILFSTETNQVWIIGLYDSITNTCRLLIDRY